MRERERFTDILLILYLLILSVNKVHYLRVYGASLMRRRPAVQDRAQSDDSHVILTPTGCPSHNPVMPLK